MRALSSPPPGQVPKTLCEFVYREVSEVTTFMLEAAVTSMLGAAVTPMLGHDFCCRDFYVRSCRDSSNFSKVKWLAVVTATAVTSMLGAAVTSL